MAGFRGFSAKGLFFHSEDYFRGGDSRIYLKRIRRGLFSWRGFEDLLEEDLLRIIFVAGFEDFFSEDS